MAYGQFAPIAEDDPLRAALAEADEVSRMAPAPRSPRQVRPASAGGGSGSPKKAKRSLLQTAADIGGAIANPGGALAKVLTSTPQGREIGKGIGAGIIRAPALALGGLMDTAEDVGRWTVEGKRGDAVADFLVRRAPTVARGIITADKALKESAVGQAWKTLFDADGDGDMSYGAVLSGRNGPVGTFGNQTANKVTAEVVSIGAGFGLASKATKAGAVGQALKEAPQMVRFATRLSAEAIGSGVAAAVVMDPEEERFSNLLTDHGIHTEFTDWLAQDDKDGKLEGRFKNAVENTVLAGSLDLVFQTARYWRAAARGKAKDAQAIQERIRTMIAERAPRDPATGQPIQPTPAKVRPGTPEEAAADNLDRAFARSRTQAWKADAQATRSYRDLVEGQPGTPDTVDLDAPAARPVDPEEARLGPSVPGTPERTGTGAGVAESAPQGGSAMGPEAQEVLDAGTRHVDIQWSDLPDVRRQMKADAIARKVIAEDPEGVRKAVTADVNAALERAGASERFIPANVDIDRAGKVVVSDSSIELLEAEGLAQAFTTSAKAARKGAPIFVQGMQDSSRLIGVLDDDAVKAFYDDVERLTAQAGEEGRASLDVTRESAKDLARSVGEHKLSPIGISDDVPAYLRALVERAPATGRPRPDAEVMSLAKGVADAMGTDATVALDFARKVAGQTDNLDTAFKVIQTYWNRMTTDIDRLAPKSWATATPEEIEEAARAIHAAQVFTSYKSQVSTSLGRALRQHRVPDLDTYIASLKQGTPDAAPLAERDMRLLPANKEEVADFMELWGMLGNDSRAKAKMLEGMLTVPEAGLYLRRSFANLFTANILSGVPTIMMNVISPAVVSGLRTLEKSSGAAIAAIVERDPQRKAELLATASKAPVAWLQTMGDMAQVLKWGADSARYNRRFLGGGSVIDTSSNFGPVTDRMLAAANATPSLTQKAAYVTGNFVNLWPRAFQRLNNGLDEMSVRLSYLGEVRARALVEASTKGLRGEDAAGFVRKALEDSTDEVGHAVDQALVRTAQRSTMTASLGAEPGYVGKFANMVNDFRANVPEARYIIPIFNVPANALGEGLRRIPMANLLLKETRRELAGEMGAVAQAEAYGRMMTGAATLMLGFGMARQGDLTGAGPQDPNDRKVWLQTNQPYSIRIGGQWVRYDRFDVIGAVLGIPATLYDRSVHRELDQDFGDKAALAAGALAQYFKDRAAVRGISDLFNVGASPTQDPAKYMERLAGSIGSRLVVPNFVTQLGRNMTDPVARGRADVGDYLWDALPFTSKSVDPLRNVLGEPVFKPQDTLVENLLPVTFAPVSDYAKDPELDEIGRIYEATGYAPGVLQAGQVLGGGKDARDLKLEDSRSLYEHVAQVRGIVENEDGLTLRAALRELFASVDYEEAADADASNRTTASGQLSRGALIADVFKDFNAAAKRHVAEQSPKARRYMAVGKIKAAGDVSTAGYSADDLASDDSTGLLEDLGINVADYEDKVTAP